MMLRCCARVLVVLQDQDARPADITALAYSARDVSVICFHTGRTTTRAQTSLMIRCI